MVQCVCCDPLQYSLSTWRVFEEERLGQLSRQWKVCGRPPACQISVCYLYSPCQDHFWCLFIHALPRQMPPHSNECQLQMCCCCHSISVEKHLTLSINMYNLLTTRAETFCIQGVRLVLKFGVNAPDLDKHVYKKST